MGDPISHLLGAVTFSLESTQTLAEKVKSYKNRDRTLQSLQTELEDLSRILTSLKEITDVDSSVLLLLKGPVDRCGRVCNDFKIAMDKFGGGKANMGRLDWARMEFMSRDIRDFIDTLAGYKQTIAIAVGTANLSTLRNAVPSKQLMDQMVDLIQDASHALNLNIDRINEAMERLDQSTGAADACTDLQDERDVTNQCLQICEDVKSYLDSLINRQPVLQETGQKKEGWVSSQFEAQLLTQNMINESRDKALTNIIRIQERLGSLDMGGKDTTYKHERNQLQEDIAALKQCSEVLSNARQKIHTFGEVIADEGSDQVVVTTFADLFDIRKITAKKDAGQLVGSMSDESLQKVSSDRYSSGFGKFIVENSATSSGPSNTRLKKEGTPSSHSQELPQETVSRGSHTTPRPNEVRRRNLEGDNNR